MENKFTDKKLDVVRAEKFGFIKSDGAYVYSCKIMNGKFILHIVANSRGVRDTLSDAQTGDEYVLHRVMTANGEFVGRVRAAYDDAIESIINACCTPDVFRAKQTRQIIEYAEKHYGNSPEYLWTKFPRNAVLRRDDNKKWYAAILSVPQNRIYGKSDDIIEILDIRAPADEIAHIIDNEYIFPGWHMNKKSWVTIVLDGRMKIADIKRMLDTSFAIAAQK